MLYKGLCQIAQELDTIGWYKEADDLTSFMIKQSAASTGTDFKDQTGDFDKSTLGKTLTGPMLLQYSSAWRNLIMQHPMNSLNGAYVKMCGILQGPVFKEGMTLEQQEQERIAYAQRLSAWTQCVQSHGAKLSAPEMEQWQNKMIALDSQTEKMIQWQREQERQQQNPSSKQQQPQQNAPLPK